MTCRSSSSGPGPGDSYNSATPSLRAWPSVQRWFKRREALDALFREDYGGPPTAEVLPPPVSHPFPCPPPCLPYVSWSLQHRRPGEKGERGPQGRGGGHVVSAAPAGSRPSAPNIPCQGRAGRPPGPAPPPLWAARQGRGGVGWAGGRAAGGVGWRAANRARGPLQCPLTPKRRLFSLRLPGGPDPVLLKKSQRKRQ